VRKRRADALHRVGVRSTLLVTEECLLDPSRNPNLGREGVEEYLKEYLGIEKVVWLWRGMAGDDEVVNGHVDNMACFAKPGTICISWTEDVTDPQVSPWGTCATHHSMISPQFDNTSSS
jgi:agmatine/peptidylarginine deiminase